jgi:flagellar hook-basal body complex protein FliE
MNVGPIGNDQIQSMLSQLRSTASRINLPQTATGVENPLGALNLPGPSSKVDFSKALKSALDQVQSYQSTSDSLGKKFALGDNSVALSDVMMAGQKASISSAITKKILDKRCLTYDRADEADEVEANQ